MDNSVASQCRVEDSLAEICFERFLRVWQDSNALSPLRRVIVFLSGLTLICGAAALIGAVPTRIYGHDIFIYLGNGWRLINGQRPHVDFTSPWGPIGFLASALGLTISHHSANGIGYGSSIVAAIVGIWSFLLGKNRLRFSSALILSFFLAALIAAPYPLGLSPFNSSYAMVYNRYGYALLGLVLLESIQVVGRLKISRRDELIGGISTGALLSLQLFLKASFFFMAVALIIILALLLRRFAPRRLLGMLLGFSGVSTCVLAYLRFDIVAVVRDLRMAAGARAETMNRPTWIVLNHWPVLLGVVFFCAAAALLFGSRAAHWRGLKLPVLGAIFFFADVGLIRSNAQADGFLVCSIFAVLLISEITEDQKALPEAEAHSYRPAYAAVLCLGALLFIPQFMSDLLGLAFGLWQKERPSKAAALLRFTSPNLKSLLLYDSDDNPPSEGRMFTTYVNEGVALLEREARSNEKVLTMDVTNPFPYAMERSAPRGGHAAPTYNYNMTDNYRPSEDWFFGDADIVMVPKRPSQGDNHYVDFYRAYGPALKQRYTLASETNLWWMYRRK